MVKKKQFINKKNAQHFHVVHRSQRDPKVNDPDASKYVLLSSKKQVELVSDDEEFDDEYDDEEEEEEDEDEEESDDDMPDLVDSPRSDGQAPKSFEAAMEAAKKKKPVAKAKAPAKAKTSSAFPTRKVRFGGIVAEDLVDENGMVRDGYDYTQHMKEMGKGRFYSAHGEFASQMDLARPVALPEDVLPSVDEQDRLLEAITLTTETMDDDLREALINDDAFEEIDDDFVMQAAIEDPDSAETDGFDYDAHIAKLMAAASGVPKYRGDLTDDEDEDDDDDDEEFDSEEEEDMDLDAYNGVDRSERQRLLDEAFEKMMAEEYDDDQLGELEEDDPETRGEVELEGELLKSIVDDFVQVRQELLDEEGKIGNPLRTGNRLKEIIEECEKERIAEEGETEDEDVDPAMTEQEQHETEEQLRAMFERNAYLAPREEEQWDCETIVSTYSNLDNHPTLIREDGLLKKKKKKKQILTTLDEEALAAAARNKSQIVLSKKTGMPLGVFEVQSKKEKKEMEEAKAKALAAAEALSAPKNMREESKEDKKARKEAAKLQKQQRRQEKKQWKTAFKEEEQRQLHQTQPGKVSIFKYT